MSIVLNFSRMGRTIRDWDITLYRVRSRYEQDYYTDLENYFEEKKIRYLLVGSKKVNSILLIVKSRSLHTARISEMYNFDKLDEMSDDNIPRILSAVLAANLSDEFDVQFHRRRYYDLTSPWVVDLYQDSPIKTDDVYIYPGYKLRIVKLNGNWGLIVDATHKLVPTHRGSVELGDMVADVCPVDDCIYFENDCPLSPLKASFKGTLLEKKKVDIERFKVDGKTLLQWSSERCKNDNRILEGLTNRSTYGVVEFPTGEKFSYPIDRLRVMINLENIPPDDRKLVSRELGIPPRERYEKLINHLLDSIVDVNIFGLPLGFAGEGTSLVESGVIERAKVRYGGSSYESIPDMLANARNKYKKNSIVLYLHRSDSVAENEIPRLLRFFFSNSYNLNREISRGKLPNITNSIYSVHELDTSKGISGIGNRVILSIYRDRFPKDIREYANSKGIGVQFMNLDGNVRAKLTNIGLGIAAKAGIQLWVLDEPMSQNYLGVHKETKGQETLISVCAFDKTGKFLSTQTLKVPKDFVADRIPELIQDYEDFRILCTGNFTKEERTALGPHISISLYDGARIFDTNEPSRMPKSAAYVRADEGTVFMTTTPELFAYREQRGMIYHTPEVILLRSSKVSMDEIRDVYKMCKLNLGSDSEVTKLPAPLHFASRANSKAVDGFPEGKIEFPWFV